MSVNQGSTMAVHVSLWLSCLLVLFTLSFGFSTGSSDKGDDYLHYQLDNPFTSHSENVYVEPLSRHRYRRSPMEFDEENDRADSSEKNRSHQKKVPSSPKSSNESQAPEDKDTPPIAPSTELLGKTPAPPSNVNQTGKDENPVPYHLVPSGFTKKVEQSTAMPVNTSTPAPVAPVDPVAPVGKEGSVEEDSMPEEITNSTLAKHNITRTEEDHHQYYNSSFIVDPDIGHSYWVNLKKKDGLRINDMLSKSYRRAATVKLSFDFPFYGSIVRNVTIATGGFLYTGEYVHSWLAATQYIAPLMANFDTRISNDSLIMYHDNGTAFTVQWEKVKLQDHPTEGEFTFQVTLHKNGDITFVYQNVPVIVEQIKDDHHPVKVGLSDAYIMDRTIFYVRRKTIYEYHRVDFRKEDIKNWTVIHLSALPTCLDLKDCNSCLTEDIGFECNWCESAGRCSNGLDRHRQDWLMKGCPTSYVQSKDHCLAVPVGPAIEISSSSAPPFTKDAPSTPLTKDTSWSSEVSHSQQSDLLDNYGQRTDINGNIDGGSQSMPISASGIVLLVLVASLIAGIGLWIFYAYRNPHTFSGQFLIKYRPSQWSWSRGEARYTAATIHM